MTNSFEALLAIEVNGVPIELVGEVTEEIFDVKLSDWAMEQLRNISLGNVTSAIKELLRVLEVDVTFDIEGELRKIPGVGDTVADLLALDLYLTDLEYKKGDRLVVGFQIRERVDVKVLTVTRIGLKITHSFAAESAD